MLLNQNLSIVLNTNNIHLLIISRLDLSQRALLRVNYNETINLVVNEKNLQKHKDEKWKKIYIKPNFTYSIYIVYQLHENNYLSS